jgi:hypothetical protein
VDDDDGDVAWKRRQTYISSVTSDGLSEISRLGRESRGSSCKEREEGCE